MDELIANDTEAVRLQLLMAKKAPFTRALRRISGGWNQEVLHICLFTLAADSRGSLRQMCSQMLEAVRAVLGGRWSAHAWRSPSSERLLSSSPLGEGGPPLLYSHARLVPSQE